METILIMINSDTIDKYNIEVDSKYSSMQRYNLIKGKWKKHLGLFYDFKTDYWNKIYSSLKDRQIKNEILLNGDLKTIS